MLIRGQLLVAAAVAAVAFAPPAGAGTLDDIAKAGVMKVATNPDFPPYGSLDKDQKLVGYDPEVTAMLAKELGVKYELVPTTAPNRISYLQTKKVDLIIASLATSPERAKAVDFSIPYGAVFQGIFGPPNLAVHSVADLAGKTVGTVRGTTQDLELTEIAPAGTDIRRFEDNNIAMTAFTTGQVQLIATADNLAEALATRLSYGKPEKKVPLSPLPIAVGIIKGDAATKSKLDAFIMAKKQSGELDALSMKWFGQKVPDFK
jgi:polar amino acid transport system substrate-binding protein